MCSSNKWLVELWTYSPTKMIFRRGAKKKDTLICLAISSLIYGWKMTRIQLKGYTRENQQEGWIAEAPTRPYSKQCTFIIVKRAVELVLNIFYGYGCLYPILGSFTGLMSNNQPTYRLTDGQMGS